MSFHIPQQPLGDALKALGAQSGLTIAVPPRAQGTLVPQICGSYTAGEALALMLTPAGLKAEFLDESTVVIREAGEPAEQSRHRCLALIFHILVGMYFCAQFLSALNDAILSNAAGRSLIGTLAEVLMNDLLATLPVCGMFGAVVGQVFRREPSGFSVDRTLCRVYVGAVAGLLAPAIAVLGISPIVHTGHGTSLKDAPAMIYVLATLAGYAGESFFERLTRKVIGG